MVKGVLLQLYAKAMLGQYSSCRVAGQDEQCADQTEVLVLGLTPDTVVLISPRIVRSEWGDDPANFITNSEAEAAHSD